MTIGNHWDRPWNPPLPKGYEYPYVVMFDTPARIKARDPRKAWLYDTLQGSRWAATQEIHYEVRK